MVSIQETTADLRLTVIASPILGGYCQLNEIQTVPLLYLLASLEYFIRFAYVGQFKPIVTTGTAPGDIINIPFTILFLVMFFLSIRPHCSPKKARHHPEPRE